MKKLAILILVTGTLFNATAQEEKEPGIVSGNVSVLWQSYQEDSLIGAVVPPSKTGMNAFSNLIYTQGNFSAGLRYESYLNSVLGFPGRFMGTGVGYRFARWVPIQKRELTLRLEISTNSLEQELFFAHTKRET